MLRDGGGAIVKVMVDSSLSFVMVDGVAETLTDWARVDDKARMATAKITNEGNGEIFMICSFKSKPPRMKEVSVREGRAFAVAMALRRRARERPETPRQSEAAISRWHPLDAMISR